MYQQQWYTSSLLYRVLAATRPRWWRSRQPYGGRAANPAIAAFPGASLLPVHQHARSHAKAHFLVAVCVLAPLTTPVVPCRLSSIDGIRVPEMMTLLSVAQPPPQRGLPRRVEARAREVRRHAAVAIAEVCKRRLHGLRRRRREGLEVDAFVAGCGKVPERHLRTPNQASPSISQDQAR